MSVTKILRVHTTCQQRSKTCSVLRHIGVLKPEIGEHARTHHSHSLRVDHLLGAECGEISQVGQNIHGRHNRQGDDDGARKVPTEGSQVVQFKLRRQAKNSADKSRQPYSLKRLNHLLCDEIQVIPVNT